MKTKRNTAPIYKGITVQKRRNLTVRIKKVQTATALTQWKFSSIRIRTDEKLTLIFLGTILNPILYIQSANPDLKEGES